MKQKTLSMDIVPGDEFQIEFIQHDKIITDRGSKYSVTAGRVTDRDTLRAFLKRIKSDPHYANASHNSYAARIIKDGAIYETKGDDGETGAGQILLRELQKRNAKNMCICVTRWFGGEKLMADRFVHVQNAARFIFSHLPPV